MKRKLCHSQVNCTLRRRRHHDLPCGPEQQGESIFPGVRKIDLKMICCEMWSMEKKKYCLMLLITNFTFFVRFISFLALM